jgi:Tol biopolymer transport system component
MTDFKSALTALSIMALAVFSLLAGSCGATVNYKPSTLPSLITFSSDRDKTVHVYTIKPDGTDNRTTSDDPQTLDGLPTWSPDGTRIAFTSNQSDDFEIWTMNADGSNRTKLTSMREWDGLPRWSPDGSKITFAGERHDEAGFTSYEIFVMNSDGSNVKKLTDSETWGEHTDEDEPARWNGCPTFSPDGTKILFASNRGGDYAKPVLYTMNLDGSDQKKFGLAVDVDGTDPDWSPVTNKIVFCRGSAAKGELWVMDGSSPFPLLTARKITDNIDNNRNPVWSPDGAKVAFVSDTYGNDDIFTINADGTNVRRVTYEKSHERHPSWR